MAPQPGDDDGAIIVVVPPPPPQPTPYWTRSGDPKYYKSYIPHGTYARGEDMPEVTTVLTMSTQTVTALGFDPTITGGPESEHGSGYSSPVPTRGPPPWKKHPPPSVYAAAGAVTALIIAGLAVLCGVLLWRKKKSKRRSTALQMAERAADGSSPHKTVAAHVGSPGGSSSYLQPPRAPPSAILAGSSSSSVPTQSDQPVILSRTMEQSYYTGIDTSDGVSLVEARSRASYAESTDEPPPPYRPASVPPISRDNSMRISNGITLDRNLRNSIREIRSPFDDPEEEPAEVEEERQRTVEQSQTAGMTQPSRRPDEASSEVSDLSYQQETRPHSNL